MMANYKQQLIETVHMGGHTRNISSIETIKIIHVSANNTTATAFKDENGDYQVPSGKTFKAIAYTYWTSAVTVVTIYEAATAAATTTLKYTRTARILTTESHLPINFEVASEKYVTYKNSLTSNNELHIIGVEY